MHESSQLGEENLISKSRKRTPVKEMRRKIRRTRKTFLENQRPETDIDHEAGKAKSFSCSDCPKNFRLKRSLEAHIKYVHGKNSRGEVIESAIQQEGVCLHPTHAFPVSLHPRRMALHKNSHQPTLKPIQLKRVCKLCRKSFKSLQDLASHEQIFHQSSSKSLECDFCDGVFSSRLLARKHALWCFKRPKEDILEETMITFGSEKYFCFICQEDVENKGNLLRINQFGHKRSQHRLDMGEYNIIS